MTTIDPITVTLPGWVADAALCFAGAATVGVLVLVGFCAGVAYIGGKIMDAFWDVWR